MGNTKTSLLITLFSCMSLRGGAYTKASVQKLRELLEKHHNKKIKRRWTFYCLAAFEAAGLITRRVRIINNSDGTVRQLSSMIAFTIKGAKYLMANKVEGSILLLKQILSWLKGRDKRFPKLMWRSLKQVVQSISPKWQRCSMFAKANSLISE